MQNSDTPIYLIGTVARKLGVSVQILRKYESEGLILPFKSEGNQRLYSELDIERLKCIRKAINEEKISMAGMRRIHSLIPCWEIIGCSYEERNACSGFNKHNGGCWTYKHESNVCETNECRLCEVYKLSNDCGYIKEQIKNSMLVQHEQLLKHSAGV